MYFLSVEMKFVIRSLILCLLTDEYTLSKAMTMAAGSSGAPGASRGRTPRPSPAPPPSAAHDSESDSSGSPCTECNSNPSYRVPINTPKGKMQIQHFIPLTFHHNIFTAFCFFGSFLSGVHNVG